MFSGFFSDLRFALRALIARPGFSIAAILTLALGIGANTAVFSVLNGLLLKPLPYADGERLVQVYNVYPKMNLFDAGTSIPDYLDRKREVAALADLALYSPSSFNLSDEGAPQRLIGIRATSSLFSTLGVDAAMGRTFGEESEVIGQDHVAVISHNAWQNLFAGDPDIVGKDVKLNSESYKILGVMPQGFAFPNKDAQFWVPFAFTPEQRSDDERGNEYSGSVGRLAPGATVEQLNSQLRANALSLAERIAGLPDERAAGYASFIRDGGFYGAAKSLREQWVGEIKPVLFLLQSVVALVLLIACANVANLMLTRVYAREKELSVKTAMGAGRWRIARQLLSEATVLSLIGGGIGIVVAYLALHLLDVFNLAGNKLADQINIDPSVLMFTLLLSTATGVLFGLMPALSPLNTRLHEVLKEGGRSMGGSRGARMTRSILVVAQLGLAVSLLVGAGLLIRSFWSAQAQDPGFARDNTLTAKVDLPEKRYSEDAQRSQFFERALAEIGAIPGASSAAFVSNLPFGNSNWTSSYNIDGREVGEGQPSPHGYTRIVDENFFATMNIPVLQGRTFEVADSAEANGVVVIDQVLARKYFPQGDAVGQRILWGGRGEAKAWTIIGVVGTIKNINLTDEVTKESYYFSYRQQAPSEGFLVLKTQLPPDSLVGAVRDAVLRVDPLQPVHNIKTLDQRIAISMEGRRAPMVLILIFALVALVLSIIGIYGVLSHMVQQRTSEIGVRMAIGANAADVQRLVLGQGARIVGYGLGLGIVGALTLSWFMQSQLFGVSSADPLTLMVVTTLLGGVALFACWLTAHRAAATQPLMALRQE
ncbi:MAG: ABC transporter permease [Lysobacterales bacterium]